MSLELPLNILEDALSLTKGIIKRFKSVKEANRKCENINKKLEFLQENIENCLKVVNDGTKSEQLKAFITNLEKIQEMLKNLLGKKSIKKGAAPFSFQEKDIDDIEQEVNSAEMNFNMFLSINNFKTINEIYRLQKRTNSITKKVAKEISTPMNENFKMLQDAIEDIKSQLPQIQKTMDGQPIVTFKTPEQNLAENVEKNYQQLQESLDQVAKSMHKQAEQMKRQSEIFDQYADQQAKMMEALDKQEEKMKKHLDQQFEMAQREDESPDEEKAVAKRSDGCHKIVAILRRFKSGPKIVRNTVNAVTVFFNVGFAGLKLYTEDRSSKERIKHLQENSKRKNMSKAYAEKHKYHIQLIENESSSDSFNYVIAS